MKTTFALLLIVSLACHSALSCSTCEGHALKCYSCVGMNEEDCNRQGSSTCPHYADACSTITGANTVMKSCTFKSFCDKAQGESPGARMHCCFSDSCNGPPRTTNPWAHYHTNGVGAVSCSPILLITGLLLRVALSHL
ncbi:CD59 glycoprotein isoform X1 [Labrus mixtus]|uniref:CD59 glycoprotein isoform X1 n=1 Tax=Labrus mixtus TaxID=508554 RepID=UPI0029BFF144|nr:CD59 glycoprotein isoform X1 [Labrus mixtus]